MPERCGFCLGATKRLPFYKERKLDKTHLAHPWDYRHNYINKSHITDVSQN